jgi:hypothetical protein
VGWIFFIASLACLIGINAAARRSESLSLGLLFAFGALQMEAEQVVRDIMLMELAQPIGNPVLARSAALGLMVWRDLDADVNVVCPRAASRAHPRDYDR